MAKYLIRDRSSVTGYKEVDPPGGVLPRTEMESYVPWGITLTQKIVYARTGEHTSWNGGRGLHKLTPYNHIASQNRRRLCQSEFGVLALNRTAFTKEAVDKVSIGVKNYLVNQFSANMDNAVNCVYQNIGHYFYTKGRNGFGRISQEDKTNIGPKKVWLGILETLLNGRLEQKLAIHDAVGRKILPELQGNQHITYERLGPKVREGWFDDPKKRGRAPNPVQAKPTNVGGISSANQNVGVGQVEQSRDRGVDMYIRDTKRTRDTSADQYYDDLDTRNLLFGAGISGTTGTLLQAAAAFGPVDQSSIELLKQYTMAIVGYLVGGGMHSYHETMAVASKVGVPYRPGAYITSLPDSFKHTPEFKQWNEKYYDIATLGAIHWRYNAGALPSHLNRDLVI